MGKRINLADLADEPILDAPVPLVAVPNPPPTIAPLNRIAPNPRNPRESLGDLADLVASLQAMGQLQPCTVVSRSSYIAQYPEDEPVIGDVDYVVIAGGRRRAAAELAGFDTLDINVKDSVADSRASLVAAAVTENIERQNFDALEEARAVRELVEVCGTGTAVAERLSRTKGWVSQRLALLKLTPEMQALVRSGDIPVRDARRLATLDPGEQMSTWRAEQEASRAPAPERFTAVNDSPAGTAVQHTRASSTRGPAAAVRRLGKTPAEIAAALRQHLSPADLRTLISLLGEMSDTQAV